MHSFMAPAATSISGTNTSLHLNFSPMTFMPGTSPCSTMSSGADAGVEQRLGELARLVRACPFPRPPSGSACRPRELLSGVLGGRRTSWPPPRFL